MNEEPTNQPAGMSGESRIAIIVCFIFLIVVSALVYRMVRKPAASPLEPSWQNSDCGQIRPESLTAIGQNVLGMGDGQRLCAYNFILNKWVGVQQSEPPAPQKP